MKNAANPRWELDVDVCTLYICLYLLKAIAVALSPALKKLNIEKKGKKNSDKNVSQFVDNGRSTPWQT